MKASVRGGSIVFEGAGCSMAITLHRTLRLPEDGKTHALPPSMGHFPIKLVDDYRDKVPPAWVEHGGVFLPLHQREAMWLGFQGGACAIKVAAGKVNAVSGKPWDQTMKAGRGDEQDYMVAPPQPWLDGFNAGSSIIKQFVAMPMGMGYTVEKQVTGKEDVGGIQLLVIPPKADSPARRRAPSILRDMAASFGDGNVGMATMDCYMSSEVTAYCADRVPSSYDSGILRSHSIGAALPKAAQMGLGAGGSMAQKIYPDPYGLDTWDEAQAGRIFVHLVNAEMYEQITGEKPPASPVDAHAYQGPWFNVNDGGLGDVQAPANLAGVKTIADLDKGHGFEGQQDDSPVNPVSSITITVGAPGVRDGTW